MKFKKVFFIVIISICSIVGAFSIYNHQTISFRQALIFPKGSTYAREWKKVDSLAGKGLTKSALELVQAIYDKAKAENNAPQFVKAIIHRMKFEQSMEEYSLIKALNKLNEEAKDARYPVKPVLQSMIAESYWQYYQDNRWNFYERTQTTNFDNNDISTWDLKTIVNQTIKNYQASLENTDSLKHTPLNIYDDVISVTQAESRKFRPTLYDFLAHRAADFYMNEEPDLISPAYKFELTDANAFGDYNDFIKIKFESKDSLSLKFYAIKTLQELIAFHAKDVSPKALIDVDLKRLKFVKNKSTLENKDDLYLSALQNLVKRFSSDPVSSEINYEIAQFYVEKGNKYNPVTSEDNKWFKKQALELCETVIKKFPGSDGAINCNVLKAQIKEHSIDFMTEKVNLPNQPFRALLHYKNLKTVYARIVQVDINKYNKSIDRYYGEKLMEQYLKLNPVKEWTTELPDDGDYQLHSTEIRIPELPSGHYVILIGSDKSFSYKNNAIAFSATWISNISYVNRRNQSNGSYDFYVQHRASGAPLKNVTAQLYYEKYSSLLRRYEYVKAEKYTTDENGFFNIPPVEDYRNISIDFTYNAVSPDGKEETEHLQTDNGIYQYKTNKEEKQKHPKTFFFLDRGIYRPGQTVYFKGIMINTDGETNEIMPNEKTTVTFYDVNQQKVTDVNLTTNEYGTFTGTFTTPVGVLNGQMSLTNGNGSVYFSVEDYKRPKFEVTFNPVKGSYQLNENIKVNGIAKAYSGAVIDGAEVKYRVVRNTSFAPWFYDYAGERGMSDFFRSTEMEITNGVTKTNDTGVFFVDFKAIPDLSLQNWSPIYNYTIYADVTDINGETHSSETVVKVSTQSLILNVDIPDKINKEEKKKYAITVTNLMGEPEEVYGELEILKMDEPDKILRSRLWAKPDKFAMKKDEFESQFPNDIYNNEDDHTSWPKGKKMEEVIFNTPKDSLDLAKLKIKDWKPGLYMLMAYFKDKNHQQVVNIKYFTLYSDKETTVPGLKPEWFVKLKDSGEPGEKAKFLIGSAEKNVKVLYEIEHKGEIVKKDFILLNNEQKTIEIPIEEKHRGNFTVHFLYVKNNRVYKEDAVITVPYTNKQLDISFETFRDKLQPGQKEEWKIKIKDKKGEKLAAEMMATLYDASLDVFRPNDWYFNIYNSYYSTLNWDQHIGFGTANAQLFGIDWNTYPKGAARYYDQLNWFGYSNGNGYNDYDLNVRGARSESVMTMEDSAAPAAAQGNGNMGETKELKKYRTVACPSFLGDEDSKKGKKSEEGKMPECLDLSKVSARSNFSETAFFYPQLETDKEGNVIIKFTIPEALTKWKMIGLAHTKDLKYGQIEKELVTQKDLMVVPNAPRFFRENDKMEFTAKISNLSDKELTGVAQIFFYDATTMKELLPSPLGEGLGLRSFTSPKGQSSLVSWNITIPEGVGAITYKVLAKAGNFTDGEEMAIPVLTNRMLVTETLPLPVRGNQTKTFRFEKLINQNNNSTTLRNHKLSLEFTSNPAWYAVQALPYLMEYPYECSEQTFSRFYANSIASHITNSSPKIKAVFDSWRLTPNPSPKGEGSLLSNLEKNQELKSLMLEETPWVLQAKDETERKKRVALLFDLNKMSSEQAIALKKLKKAQLSNGGWPWFDGMPEDDRYITQHIITGMGHLDHLGIKNIHDDAAVWNMIQNGVKYLDNRIHEDYEWILKHDKAHMDDNHLSYQQIQYLYARSYFKDIAIDNSNQKAFDYYKAQEKKYWLQNSRYMQGMIALALNRYEDKITPKDIMKSLKENSLNSEEMGMYWKENYGGYYWYQAPIESQALLIEAFDEVANDKKAVDDLKVWLLKSKQTQDWKTTKATTEAVYALLLRGTDWLSTESKVEITIGDKVISGDNSSPSGRPGGVEAGTGYFKTSWSSNDINSKMGEITVTKKDAGVSWGAMYWQYFEQLDKITPAKTPLNLKKQLFLQKNTDAGPVIEPITEKTILKVGDKIKVRIELRVDRDMEYVQMKDMRASGFEPTNVVSSYKYQDGLGYYESTRDAATNFFFSYLSKGTYVFEYPMVVTHNGDFSNGITSIQCMYAPEFASNSEGVRIKVGK